MTSGTPAGLPIRNACASHAKARASTCCAGTPRASVACTGRCRQYASSRISPALYAPPPKSTGRDLFNLRWLDDRLAAYDGPAPAPQDVQATLQRLTARTVANAIDAAAADTREVYVCLLYTSDAADE